MSEVALTIMQGETFIFSFESLGVDLTNYSAKIQFRENVSSLADSVLQEVTNISMDSSGVITIRIESADTYAFDWIDGMYDIILVDGSNKRSKPFAGQVEIIPSVTR